MEDNPNRVKKLAQSPVRQLAISLLLVLIAGSAIFAVFLFAGNLIFGTGELVPDIRSVQPSEDTGYMRYLLVAQDLSYFIIPSMIFLLLFNPGYKTGIFSFRTVSRAEIVLVILLALCAFPVILLTGELNAGLKLPHWLSGVEEWIRIREEDADDILSAIMGTRSVSGMFLNLFLVAVLPALSEEMLFRGVFQKVLANLFRSGNAAVWITSFVFSAMHLQFYGFLPRFILGLIFGYIFLWSSNIWLPFTAHFINNAVPVIGTWLGGLSLTGDSGGAASGPQIAVAAICLVILVMVMSVLHSGRSSNGNDYLANSQDHEEEQ